MPYKPTRLVVVEQDRIAGLQGCKPRQVLLGRTNEASPETLFLGAVVAEEHPSFRRRRHRVVCNNIPLGLSSTGIFRSSETRLTGRIETPEAIGHGRMSTYTIPHRR